MPPFLPYDVIPDSQALRSPVWPAAASPPGWVFLSMPVPSTLFPQSRTSRPMRLLTRCKGGSTPAWRLSYRFVKHSASPLPLEGRWLRETAPAQPANDPGLLPPYPHHSHGPFSPSIGERTSFAFPGWPLASAAAPDSAEAPR